MAVPRIAPADAKSDYPAVQNATADIIDGHLAEVVDNATDPHGVKAWSDAAYSRYQPTRRAAGRWLTPRVTFAAMTNLTAVNEELYAVPVYVDAQASLDDIAVRVKTAGNAGSVVRLGIYTDSNGVPDSLLLDAGTATADTAAVKRITIAQTLPSAGWYWIAVAAQGASTTAPVVQGFQQSIEPIHTTNIGNAVDLGVTAAFSRGLVSGALPATFGAVTERGTGPRLAVRLT